MASFAKDPLFPDMITALVFATLVTIGMNLSYSLVQKRLVESEKMKKIMKQVKELRSQLTLARFRKNSDEFNKIRIHLNKLHAESMQLQFRQSLIFIIFSSVLGLIVYPVFFGETTDLSPIQIPWITCNSQNVQSDVKIDKNGEPLGPCSVPGEVYLWAWFTISAFAFSGNARKILLKT